MAQAQSRANAQTLLLRECSLVMRVFDENGNEVKPSVIEINTTGRIEAWSLPQGKAIIATVNPFHYEDEYDTIDSYSVKLYCYNNGSMRLVGVVFVNNPLDDITSHLRSVLERC
jgi:hypothetical protein